MPPPQTGAKAFDALAVPPFSLFEESRKASLTPVTWVDGAGYCIHRNGSKASSSSVLTGSHHPPALWKARNDYYSSSQPLQIFIILEKSNG